jgi:hypothetical protein
VAGDEISHRSSYDYVIVGSPHPGQEPDPCLEEWRSGRGAYTTNEEVLGIIEKLWPERQDPDLFIFGLPGFFKGYYPRYSEEVEGERNHFAWAIFKAHTLNTAGKVTLGSNDPRDMPHINFRYFDEGNDASGDHLEAIVEGVEFVRRMMSRTSEVIERELVPGGSVSTRKQIREFVRNEAWGHHASCTCKMGPKDDEMAVVDSDFPVHGTRNLSGRRVGLPSYPRFRHRHGRVHDQRESERCHPRRRNDGSRTCEADVQARNAPRYVRLGGKEHEPTPRNRRPAQDFGPAERCRSRGARPVVVGALLPNAAVRAVDRLGSCNK